MSILVSLLVGESIVAVPVSMCCLIRLAMITGRRP